MKTKQKLTINFPLRPLDVEMEIEVDWSRKVMRFREAGTRKWHQIALWCVAETAGLDPKPLPNIFGEE